MDDTTNPERLLLKRERVAKLLDVGMRTFDRMVSTGQFPAADVKLSAKLVRWSRGRVVDWIDNQGGRETVN